LMHDVATVALLTTSGIRPDSPGVSMLITVAAALVVVVVAPEPLRRILRTRPLPAEGLRARLEQLSARAGTRHRDVLLWHTDYGMGNAAVMGVIPQVRYVLLSDLLLESMKDRQIEAVFAHELGHVVHRHTLWFLLFLLVFVLLLGFCELAAAGVVSRLGVSDSTRWAVEVGGFALAVAVGVTLFGFFSRRLERQADVYAARVIQQAVDGGSGDPRRYPVGVEGALALGSALQRAAAINHIPPEARSFRHGSVLSRIGFIQRLAGDPRLTRAFDRSMLALYAALFGSLIVGSTAAAWLIARGYASW
ncbi:MAG: M48 family metalloprotease, partial [Phycisphaerales bacterium]|nr:M48 family metalloprotease [Phycisphaerales bacterium]